MAPLDAKQTYSSLLKKGFQEAKNKSCDHKWLEFWNDGKLTRVKTKMSHGEKEINDSLISLMARQTYLTSHDFREFAECNLNQEGYILKLKQRNLL
jgi:predicted RNA binding protein YcfA (HicA-like mRNA interferase family)